MEIMGQKIQPLKGVLSQCSPTHYQCCNCEERYPILNNKPTANGKEISRCVWCRPELAPWKKQKLIIK
jgi:hypothetical protein